MQTGRLFIESTTATGAALVVAVAALGMGCASPGKAAGKAATRAAGAAVSGAQAGARATVQGARTVGAAATNTVRDRGNSE